MSTTPFTVTIVTSHALYGVGWERYYYNGELAYNGTTRNESGEFPEGVITIIDYLISIGALDATIEHITIEPTNHSDDYDNWVTEQSIKHKGTIDFLRLDDLMKAVEADSSLEVSRYTD